MDLSIFTICDYAHAEAGKMTVVGTFNQLRSNRFPFEYDFYFAAKVVFDSDCSSDFTIDFLDSDNEPFVSQINSNFQIEVRNNKQILSDIVVKVNTVFSKPGAYHIVLTIGDLLKKTLEFYVEEDKE